jgi:hypothetical protein
MELGLLQRQVTSTIAMVATHDSDCVKKCLELMHRLRAAKIRSETAFDSGEKLSLKRQLKAAGQKGFGMCFYGAPTK